MFKHNHNKLKIAFLSYRIRLLSVPRTHNDQTWYDMMKVKV